MFGFNNRHTTSGKKGKKRFPIFSISLIACYLVVSVLFFVYGFGDRRTPAPESTPPLEEAPIAAPIAQSEVIIEPVEDEAIALPPPVQVKGIWLGAWYIVEQERLDNYIDLIETTELNALVIDIKEEHGYVTIPMESEQYPVSQNILMENMEELIEDLKSRDIYTIARVVCFKDTRQATRNPHLAHRDLNGNVWKDRRDYGWLNPYERGNWEYIRDLCLEAARIGFQEIQLDYVRFPVEGSLSTLSSGREGDEQSRTEVIAEFVTFIRDAMLEVGVRTSADVFGIIALSNNDAQQLGQDLDLLYPALHYISPMIYPSHFANITQNGVGQVINGVLFERPDTEPHGVIYNTLQHFIRRRDPEVPDQAILRPYLQDFTAAYLGEGNFLEYGPEEVRAQIQAVYDAGLHEWILWSNVSRYTEETFRNP